MKLKKLFSLLFCVILATSFMAFPQSANADAGNPVLPGYYADPDIDWFDCKFWIYPTTDGIIDERDGWWGSKTFKAFSSEDMVNWTDHGVILDVEADTAEQAGVNEYGVQIAYSPWSYGHAWAPSIEKVGNMYYFYYVAAVKEEYMPKYGAWIEEYVDNDGNTIPAHYVDDKAIGVAYSSSPTGPFTALDEPILYGKMVQELLPEGRDIPSIIDPSIFVDDDGSAYISFGNWTPCIAKLNKDMLSVDWSTFHEIKGIPHGWWDENAFMESIVIFKYNGIYFFTWSVDGTGSENYRVAYGTSNNINYTVTYRGILLEKDVNNGLLGTGHQSILKYNDRYFISYGRLHLENGIPKEPSGNYREVCVDEIQFEDRYTIKSTPTKAGVGSLSAHSYVLTSSVPATSAPGSNTYTCSVCGNSYTETVPPVVTESTTQPQAPTQTTKPTTTNKTTTQTNNAVKKPTTPKSFKVKAAKKSFKASWKKVSGVTGYEIKYSTSNKFTKKTTKTATVKGASKTSSTVKKLKSKKTYYVKVRAYKKVGSKYYYSPYTKTTKVKIK